MVSGEKPETCGGEAGAVVSLKKQSKRAQREFYRSRRGSWGGIKPVTRVVESGKAYSRGRMKRELVREMEG